MCMVVLCTGPMNRPPPPLAHTNNTGISHGGGHIFSPPQTPTSTRPTGPPSQEGMLGALAGPGAGGNNGPSVLGGHPGGHPGAHLGNLPPISSPTAHPNSSTTSPPLVVPQPIKGSQQGGPGGAPGSRSIKTYHCRMCDQVSSTDQPTPHTPNPTQPMATYQVWFEAVKRLEVQVVRKHPHVSGPMTLENTTVLIW